MTAYALEPRYGSASRTDLERRPSNSVIGVGSGSAASNREVLPLSGGRAYIFDSDWQLLVDRRLDELRKALPGWDGYCGSPLAVQADEMAVAVLRYLAPVIQSAPAVSLTVNGGALYGWETTDACCDVEIAPEGSVSVFFQEGQGHVYEGRFEEFLPLIDKWVWQASSRP
jgi:hypothetical protein